MNLSFLSCSHYQTSLDPTTSSTACPCLSPDFPLTSKTLLPCPLVCKCSAFGHLLRYRLEKTLLLSSSARPTKGPPSLPPLGSITLLLHSSTLYCVHILETFILSSTPLFPRQPFSTFVPSSFHCVADLFAVPGHHNSVSCKPRIFGELQSHPRRY